MFMPDVAGNMGETERLDAALLDLKKAPGGDDRRHGSSAGDSGNWARRSDRCGGALWLLARLRALRKRPLRPKQTAGSGSAKLPVSFFTVLPASPKIVQMATTAVLAIGSTKTWNDNRANNLLVEDAFAFAGAFHRRYLDPRRRQQPVNVPA